MAAKFLGQFLLERGTLTPAQLLAALDAQRASNPLLGELAIHHGMLDASQARRINERQRAEDRRFGDIALEMGWLSEGQLDVLLAAQKKGRKLFSRGLWAPAETIERLRAGLDAERSTAAYAKKRVADTARRERAQAEYVDTFEVAVLEFLRFAPRWHALARAVATRVTAHATPVGSGTVARTERIPVEERARAAVIAWMRHQTTDYDDRRIARVKGARREVRRELAELSREVIELHRRDQPHATQACPLCRAAAAPSA